jgi:hypothetical protein
VLESGKSLIGPAYFLARNGEAEKAALAHRRGLAFGKADPELGGRVRGNA